MIHNNTDEFTEELRESVSFDCAKLSSKQVTVDLLVEEITLIDWALTSFERENLLRTLNELAADAASAREVSRKKVESEINEAFTRIKSYQLALERLRNKLQEAVTAKIEEESKQQGLKLGN